MKKRPRRVATQRRRLVPSAKLRSTTDATACDIPRCGKSLPGGVCDKLRGHGGPHRVSGKPIQREAIDDWWGMTADSRGEPKGFTEAIRTLKAHMVKQLAWRREPTAHEIGVVRAALGMVALEAQMDQAHREWQNTRRGQGQPPEATRAEIYGSHWRYFANERMDPKAQISSTATARLVKMLGELRTMIAALPRELAGSEQLAEQCNMISLYVRAAESGTGRRGGRPATRAWFARILKRMRAHPCGDDQCAFAAFGKAPRTARDRPLYDLLTLAARAHGITMPDRAVQQADYFAD
jgi:hypothetical protein